jgi:hypothetical protein
MDDREFWQQLYLAAVGSGKPEWVARQIADEGVKQSRKMTNAEANGNKADDRMFLQD